MICFPLRRESRFHLFSRNGLNAQRVRATNKRRACATRETRTQTTQGIHNSMYYTLDLYESLKYLGQKISFHHQETTETKNRIRAAWATFRKHKQELTSKNYVLKQRLRLFDAAISPTICYAAGTWTPNKDHERMIQSTQRKMLRLIKTRYWDQRRN